MVAEGIVVVAANAAEGRITSRGRLVDRQGNRLAGFVQTLRAQRGSRVLGLDVELVPERQPGPNPWQSYYAARFAWDDPAAELFRSVNLMSWPTDAARLEAPHFVEVRSATRRTAILTGGLPYHRRVGPRKMDSLLIVRGEAACRFRLGIGIDLPHPICTAIDFLTPRPSCIERAARPRSDSGWLFHLNAPGVIATDWEPLVRDDRLVGLRARLLETEGCATRLRLRSFRRPAVARQTDFLGSALDELEIDDDQVEINLDARQWVQMEIEWEDN
jgi:alpha-mannosidase